MKEKNVITWSIVIALGGLLFGFDTAVIAGAEQAIQDEWNLDNLELGFAVSIALIGTVVGALSGSAPSDRFGRKKTLYAIAVIYLISSLGTATATSWYPFLFFRFIGGLGVGASSVTIPIYISEIAPTEKRGKLVGLFQFNVVLGIVVAYLSNFWIGQLETPSWRLMLGVQVVPSLLFLLLLRSIPESPRWLIVKRGNTEKARKIFERINPATADDIIREINESAKAGTDRQSRDPLFSPKYRTPVMLAISFAIFNQVSGINAVIFYSPRIFQMAGLGSSSSLLSTVGLGFINFTFTILAMNFIDKIGRRTLMLIGSVGLVLTLGIVSYSFYGVSFNNWVVPILLFIYSAFFAFSQGAVIWVFISEIFPTQVRAKGQTLGSTIHWTMAALIAFAFPYLFEKIGGGNTFLFFCIMMCIQFVFVWKIMPETKGKSLEQIQHSLVIK